MPSCISVFLRSSEQVLRQVRSGDRRERCDHHRRSRATARRSGPGRPLAAGLHRPRPARGRAGGGLAVDAGDLRPPAVAAGRVAGRFHHRLPRGERGHGPAEPRAGHRATARRGRHRLRCRLRRVRPQPGMGGCGRRERPRRDRGRRPRRRVERLCGRASWRARAQRPARVLRPGCHPGPVVGDRPVACRRVVARRLSAALRVRGRAGGRVLRDARAGARAPRRCRRPRIDRPCSSCSGSWCSSSTWEWKRARASGHTACSPRSAACRRVPRASGWAHIGAASPPAACSPGSSPTGWAPVCSSTRAWPGRWRAPRSSGGRRRRSSARSASRSPASAWPPSSRR